MQSIIDSLTNPCLINARNRITDSAIRNTIINNFWLAFSTPAMNIKFKEDTSFLNQFGQPEESGSFADLSTNTGVVVLNTDYFNEAHTDSTSQQFGSLLILHEIVHSFFLIWRAELGMSNVALTNITTHQAIFQNWVNLMRTALQAAYPNLTSQNATALALQGLDDILAPEYDAAGNLISYNSDMDAFALQNYGISLLNAHTIAGQYRNGTLGTVCN